MRLKVWKLLILLSLAPLARADNIFGGPNSIFNNPCGSACDQAGQAFNTVVETLANGHKQVTETFSDGIKRLTELVPGGGPIVSIVWPNGSMRVTEELGNGAQRITETVPGVIKRVIQTAGDGTKIITETLADGYTLTTQVAADGTRTVTQVLADGNRMVIQIFTDGTRVVTQVISEANKAVQALIQAQQELLAKQEDLYRQTASDAVDVAKALARYQERELKGIGTTLSGAERRIREGKVVDAIWGLNVEPAQLTEKNAAQAALENKYIAAAGQIAATTYGGPAGGAAYAAWLTYSATGDPELALKQGVLVAITSAVGPSISGMPAGTATEIAKKAGAEAALAAAQSVASGKADPKSIQEAIAQRLITQSASGVLDIPKNLGDSETTRAISDAAVAGAKAMVLTSDGKAVENAIRSSLITSITNSITSEVPVEQMRLIQKAATVAAINAVTIAASGGDEKAVLDAMAKGGSDVLVQDVLQQQAIALKQEASSAGSAYLMSMFDENTPNLQSELKNAAETFQKFEGATAQWRDAKESYINDLMIGMGIPPPIYFEDGTRVLQVADGNWTVTFKPWTREDGGKRSQPIVLTYTGPMTTAYEQQEKVSKAREELAAAVKKSVVNSR